jgi:hypothetical protein
VEVVDRAVDAFPVMGFAVVIASALTGLAGLRMDFSLFAAAPIRWPIQVCGSG